MQTVSLDGFWILTREDDPATRLAATVPGCMHADLLRTGVIADPFWRDPEQAAHWVGKTT